MSNSPQNSKTSPNKTDSKVQFKTENIGSWASRQENPFAKQNRERQAKKQERDQKRQKVAPFFVTFVSAAVIGVALWGLVMLIVNLISSSDIQVDYTPEIAGSTTEDINNYRDLLQNFYNDQQAAIIGEVNTEDFDGAGTIEGNDPEVDRQLIATVDAAVKNTLGTSNGRKNSNAVRYAQMLFYLNNGYYQEVVDTGLKIDTELLDTGQRSSFYDAMANSYYLLGDNENADIYYDYLLSSPVGE